MTGQDPRPLPGVLSQAERAKHRRCMWCEWHPPTQGHHPACPRPTKPRGAH